MKKERLSPLMDVKEHRNYILLNLSGKKSYFDNEDMNIFNSCNWFINNSGYLVRNAPIGQPVLFHRILMKARKNQIVDHINGNKLDNRKSNLRIATMSENQHNTHVTRKSLYGTGVYKLKGRFHSHIRNHGKWFFLGAYDSPKEASYAYWLKKNEFLPASQHKTLNA